MLKHAMLGLVAGSVLVAPLAIAEQEGDAVSPRQVALATHDHALANHDLDAVMATFAEADSITLIGTGPGEHWVGAEAIKEAYGYFFQDFDAGTLESECTKISEGAGGETVWMSATCNMSDSQDGIERSYPLNVTLVMTGNDEEGWRIHTMHYSNLTSAPE